MPQAAHQHSTQKSERSICVSQDWYDMRGTPIVLDVFIPRLGSKRWTDVETLGSLRSQVRKGSLIAQGKLERLVRAPTYLGGFILTSGGWHVRAYSRRVRPHLFAPSPEQSEAPPPQAPTRQSIIKKTMRCDFSSHALKGFPLCDTMPRLDYSRAVYLLKNSQNCRREGCST